METEPNCHILAFALSLNQPSHLVIRNLSRPMRALYFLLLLIAAPLHADFQSEQLVSHADGTPATPGDGGSYFCTLSQDGHYLTFESTATNLIAGSTSGTSHIYMRNVWSNSTELISRSSTPTNTPGNADSASASVSANGQFVTFQSQASNLVSDSTYGVQNIFARNRQTETTSLISIHNFDYIPSSHFDSSFPDISADGRFVVFISRDLTSDSSPAYQEVYLVDTQPAPFQVTLISGGYNFSLSNESSNLGMPAITQDGRYVVFSSRASNLVAPGADTNGHGDVFLYDRLNPGNAPELISMQNDGTQFSVDSVAAGPGSITPDARYVVFMTTPTAPGNFGQIYLRDRQGLTTTILSKRTDDATPGNQYSQDPKLSSDAQRAVFWTSATNLVSGQSGALYLNRSANQLTLASNGGQYPCISSNGLILGYNSGTPAQIYVRKETSCTIDSDSDGTPDCADSCSLDPLKTGPGSCGCGIAETDSDSDGTPDCHDTCPNDALKTAQGICGCGMAETDSDSDGTPDCNDTCPNSPLKATPGVCGCDVADTDSDSDGTPDCSDSCPNDPLKTAPGFCGCGVSDADSVGDGILDCRAKDVLIQRIMSASSLVRRMYYPQTSSRLKAVKALAKRIRALEIKISRLSTQVSPTNPTAFQRAKRRALAKLRLVRDYHKPRLREQIAPARKALSKFKALLV